MKPVMRKQKLFVRGKKSPVYLDYAASTPVSKGIAAAMRPYESEKFCNPSALYYEALEVRKDIEDMRGQIAKTLDALADEIIFTGGATEANRLAVLGVLRAARKEGITKLECIISATEHPSVRNLCKGLAEDGVITLYEVPVDNQGQVDPKVLRDMITPQTVLVSIQLVNNETGVLQDFTQLMKAVRFMRKQHGHQWPMVHTDAVQAASYQRLQMRKLGVDLVTLSSQKIFGPKGVGFLFKKRSAAFLPPFSGGGQEGGYRSGTEYVAGIIGGGLALIKAQNEVDDNHEKVSELRSWFSAQVRSLIPKSIVHEGVLQSPHICNLTVPGINGELLVIELAERGVLVSARAACSVDDPEASHVLAAMYQDHPSRNLVLRNGSVRFSMSTKTTKKELEYVLTALEDISNKYEIL